MIHASWRVIFWTQSWRLLPTPLVYRLRCKSKCKHAMSTIFFHLTLNPNCTIKLRFDAHTMMQNLRGQSKLANMYKAYIWHWVAQACQFCWRLVLDSLSMHFKMTKGVKNAIVLKPRLYRSKLFFKVFRENNLVACCWSILIQNMVEQKAISLKPCQP